MNAGAVLHLGGPDARNIQMGIQAGYSPHPESAETDEPGVATIGKNPTINMSLIKANAAAREAQSRVLIETSWKQDEPIDPTRENMAYTFDDRASMAGAVQEQARLRAEEEKTTVHHYGDQLHVFNPGPSARYRR